MRRLSLGCVVAGSIGEDFLMALAERQIEPAFVIHADGMERVVERDIPGPIDLLITIGSTAFVSAEARALAKEAIGYHPSLLPRHPGRNAVRDTIAAGDAFGGGSIYRLTDEWDRGEVLAQESCPVLPEDTPGTLWRRDLKPMGVRLMVLQIKS
jgi:methionyl-tRNA formyltransferase